ncbi:E3 SUMO-protein ligase PIAS2-like isoform X2 [Petromyzon marinus]|nr:E3 SUMO-protein ligase PIAS2-like isoform X2 [Petromyzon marinus]
MVLSFRVSELQVLLGYAGRNKSGRKQELLTRALQLLRSGCSPAVQIKIKELYRRRLPRHRMVSPGTATANTELPAVTSPTPAVTSSTTHLPYDAGSPVSPLPLLAPGREMERSLQQQLHSHAAATPPAQPPTQTLPTRTHHPVHPDVRLRSLPFYDILDELIKPTSLVTSSNQRFQETYYVFALTPQQVAQISSSRDILPGQKYDFTVQVQLRFCLSETSCPQEDHFPANLCVKVNGKLCPLPGYLPPTKNGVEPKRPSRPINITAYVRLSPTVPNHITVSWTADFGRNYSISVYLVKQLTSSLLLNRMKAKGIRNSDHSRALIKEKLTADPDSEIATTSLRVSLLCPLGKMRLTIPCRALTCTHLQCFDAALYIQMNEKKPTWVCPVCDKKAPYDSLIIDGLFMEILSSCTDVDEIKFREDGSWSPMRPKKECQDVTSPSMHFGTIDSSNSYDNGSPCSDERKSIAEQRVSVDGKKVEVIDLTLDSSSSSSSDDESDQEDDAQDSTLAKSGGGGGGGGAGGGGGFPAASPSPSLLSRGILNLHQTSPGVRGSALDSGFVPPQLTDYHPSYHHPHLPSLPPDLQGTAAGPRSRSWDLGLDLFSLLQGDSQHYSSSGLGGASSGDDQDMVRSALGGHGFFPYVTPPVYLDQLTSPVVGTAPMDALTSPVGGPLSVTSSTSSSSLLSSSSGFRDPHAAHVFTPGPPDMHNSSGPEVIPLDD